MAQSDSRDSLDVSAGLLNTHSFFENLRGVIFGENERNFSIFFSFEAAKNSLSSIFRINTTI